MMKTLWIIITGLVLLPGCGNGNASGPVVYDNHGGVAYGGHRITFHPSGKYESESYTDVVGDRHLEAGTFQKIRDTYSLDGQSGKRLYHVFIAGNVEYLLDDQDYQDYLRTKDSGLLQGQMRRSSIARD